jgi:eukaryotic-like serine/threonine-protein kinase
MQGGFVPKIGIRKGDVIADKYRVDWVLGTGSTGVVLAAYHLKLHERVAIKLLLPEASSNPEAVTRFEREARSAVKIKSQHVARIIDVGALASGAPYIVMEHLQGEDLAARLARTGPLSVEEAVDFVMQACEAIAEAHGLGIVHRDLKPANLYCVRGSDGRASIKVLDFGISKVLDEGGLHVAGEATRTNLVVGSPFYMSPEQMQAPRTVDARTDIWSIGVILHELLAGSVPFPGETLPQIAVRVFKSPPPSLRLIRSDIPPGIEGVIARCLEKSAKRRYKSVAELAADLGRFGPRKALSSVDRIRLTLKNASERPFSVTVPPDAELAAKEAAATSPPWGAPTTRTDHGRNRRTLTALLAAGAAVGAVLGVWWLGGRAGENSFMAPPGLASRTSGDSKNAPGRALASETSIPEMEPRRAADDDPTRAYSVVPGAGNLAMPPPTGTGHGAPPPRARPIEPRHAKTAPRSSSEHESETPPSVALTDAPSPLAPKGEGTCLLHLSSIPPSTVILDGKALGASPRRSISVWAGTHTVLFRSADGETKKTLVTCAPGETRAVDVRLRDLPSVENPAPESAPCPLCERP